MKISDLIKPELIKLGLNCAIKEEVIKILVDALYEQGSITSGEKCYQDIMARETQMTTGLSDGIAIPHTRSDSVVEPAICIGKTIHPIRWETLDGKDVSIVFLITVPMKNEENLHLKILSQLAEKLMDEDLRKKINLVIDFKEMIELLN